MTDAPWMTLAQTHLGEHEIAGKGYNQFILDCFKFTNYKASDDSVSWCGAFVSRMLEESGYQSAHSAWALSHASAGDHCDLKPGCLVIFTRPGGGGHVGFCHHIEGPLVYVLGGNQRDSVSISAFYQRNIMATRWPRKA